jgi:RNA polymerase sigma factor (sigma-70 family)
VATTLDNNEFEELLRRCAAQDAAALRTLYSQAAPQLLAVLMRMLRTRAAAEDALQDVFVRIWQQSGQFDRIKGRALSWMMAIARNRAIDMQRSARPTVLLEVAEQSGADSLKIEGPADGTEFSAAHAALRHCLQMLAAAQRQCLLLAYEQGLTQDKIALSIGQPLGSVKSWVRRGLQSLRTCMES